MTSFRNVFNQMFLQKRKYAHLVLLIQIIVVFVWIGIHIFRNNYVFSVNDIFDILDISIVLTDIIFTIILCSQNEKINFSSTWQLVPISTNHNFWANILSSVAECVYIFGIQIIFYSLCLLPVTFINFNKFKRILTEFFDPNGLYTLQFIVYLFLTVLLIFTFVSFTNFSSKVITDNLPIKNTKLLRLFVIIVLASIAVYISIDINNRILSILGPATLNMQTLLENPLWLTNLEFLIGTIFFSGLDMWLLNKYVEVKK